jgi:hypothetical protein
VPLDAFGRPSWQLGTAAAALEGRGAGGGGTDKQFLLDGVRPCTGSSNWLRGEGYVQSGAALEQIYRPTHTNVFNMLKDGEGILLPPSAGAAAAGAAVAGGRLRVAPVGTAIINMTDMRIGPGRYAAIYFTFSFSSTVASGCCVAYGAWGSSNRDWESGLRLGR